MGTRPARERVQTVRSGLDHVDVMAERGEAHGRDQSNVPGTDHQDPLGRCDVHRSKG